MNSNRRGSRATRGHDVMELLAQARPASLDARAASRHSPRPAGVLSPELTAIIAADEAAAPGPLTHGRRTARPGRPGWHPRRGALAGTGLSVAAAVAAAAVLAATAGGGARPSRSLAAAGQAHPVRPAPSAHAILLTAAVNAAKAPAAGRYWRVDTVSGSMLAAGPNAHPYAVEQRWSPSANWDSASAARRTWTFPAARYSSVPASPGASAAWLADGSPALPATHSRQQAWWQVGGSVGYLGNSSPTLAQFRALPSSPAGLASAVRKLALRQDQRSAPALGSRKAQTWSSGAQASLSQDIFGIYVQLLKWDPITPQVRAAVFRDIAGLPGVRSVGRIADPLGRAGYGIAMTSPQAAAGDQEVLVISSSTGAVLADEWVVTAASGGARRPASGAVPGPTSCPAGAVRAVRGRVCVLGARIVHGRIQARPAAGATEKFSLLDVGPQLALAPGQVDSFDAVISAGWTNAVPPLPPLSRQFSVVADGKG